MPSKIRKRFTYNGKQYCVYGKTEEEVIEKKVRMIVDLEQGKKKESGVHLREYALQAVERYKTNQSEITRKKYLEVMKSSVFDILGDPQLRVVSHSDLQDCLNRQKGRSKYHIDRVYHMLTFIFTKAYEEKKIKENPSINLVRPKGENGTRRALTDTEREIFLSIADERYSVFLLMYHCGLRPSEARNVTADDFVEKDGNKLLHVRGTKTEKSDRFVPVPKQLKYRESNPTQGSYNALFRRLKREMERYYTEHEYSEKDFMNGFVPYCLRHDYCTRLRDNGVDIRDAQYLMGHATIYMTANIYTHSDVATALKNIDKICK